jgi:hypothetical protein
MGVQLELFPLKYGEEEEGEFLVERFYKDLLSFGEDEDIEMD